MKRALSCAATQLLRALRARSGLESDKIIVGRFQSIDWQSLTFTGERHELLLRFVGSNARAALATFRHDLSGADWAMRGHVVADIVIVGERSNADGSIEVEIEALTLAD